MVVSPTTAFFDTIVTIAHDRPVTADDFQPFVGRQNWLLMDGDDFPLDSPFRNGGAVCEFTLRDVFFPNVVAILVKIDPLVPDGTLYHIPADELAIRMDAS